MHLKNFSVLADEHGLIRLTPAYDLLCTRLVIPDDPLSLSIQGKKDNLDRKLWLRFAKYCGLSEKAAARVLNKQASIAGQAMALIDRSFLPEAQRKDYKELIARRTSTLGD